MLLMKQGELWKSQQIIGKIIDVSAWNQPTGEVWGDDGEPITSDLGFDQGYSDFSFFGGQQKGYFSQLKCLRRGTWCAVEQVSVS